MTEREAIEVLFECASRVCKGVGVGISRGIPNEKEKTKIREAVVRLWPKVHNWDFREIGPLQHGFMKHLGKARDHDPHNSTLPSQRE